MPRGCRTAVCAPDERVMPRPASPWAVAPWTVGTAGGSRSSSRAKIVMQALLPLEEVVIGGVPRSLRAAAARDVARVPAGARRGLPAGRVLVRPDAPVLGVRGSSFLQRLRQREKRAARQKKVVTPVGFAF